MKKVVIVGGGFAGATAAKILKDKSEVTLIDTKDFFEYTPGILRVLVEPKHYEKIHANHKDYLPNAEIVREHVTEIKNDAVILSNKDQIKYDYLILASGSSYSTPIKEEDSFFATRAKHLIEANEQLKKSNKIVIVGGGLVGVELASELATHYKDKKILMIHAGAKLLERNDIKSSRYAEYFLKKNGVEIVFNEKIMEKSKKKLISESGKEYAYDSVFFTVGIKPNIDFMKGQYSRFVPKGIEVNEYLQIPAKKNIFVAGDVSNIIEEKTAQNAEKHGKVAAENILALINREKMGKYTNKKRMMVISLGKYSGIIEYKSFVMCGWIPAVLKSCIEKMVMRGFR